MKIRAMFAAGTIFLAGAIYAQSERESEDYLDREDVSDEQLVEQQAEKGKKAHQQNSDREAKQPGSGSEKAGLGEPKHEPKKEDPPL